MPVSSSSQEALISVSAASKKFCKSLKKSLWYGVQDIISELNPLSSESAVRESKLKLRDSEFWALRDVGFELRRGECLGLIGHNGAGKTTLLKMLNGLVQPDFGRVAIRGRVGALIALGAGFNPILTGRENIFVNGSVLGLSQREIEQKLDEIIDFAEVGDFIDSPVQNYSSGMTVRLGFAIASNLQPDVVLLDEVLAVGDEKFQLKCFERIGRLLNDGVAGILVTHQMQHVERTCTRCLVMDHGRVALDSGNISEAAQLYRELGRTGKAKAEIDIFHHDASLLKVDKILPRKENDGFDIHLSRSEGAPGKALISYSVHYKGCELLRQSTQTHDTSSVDISSNVLTFKIPEELRRIGTVSVNLSIWDPENRKALVWIKGMSLSSTSNSEPYQLSFN